MPIQQARKWGGFCTSISRPDGPRMSGIQQEEFPHGWGLCKLGTTATNGIAGYSSMAATLLTMQCVLAAIATMQA